MSNAINWFEIPTADFSRATGFYEQVFGAKFQRFDMDGMKMAMFPYEDPATGGAVVEHSEYKPGADGAVLYLNGGDDLAGPLSRVRDAGGQVIVEKTKINDEVGFFGLFLDTEGNRVGLHSMA